MDRRNFLKQFVGVEALRAARGDPRTPAKRVLLRSGDPLNSAGHPFGGRILCIEAVHAPGPGSGALGRARALVIAGHEDAGLSTIELVHGERGWEHDVAASGNRRFGAGTEVPTAGDPVEAESEPLGRVRCLHALPWRRVLGGEEWLVELDPAAGTVVRLFAAGRVRPFAVLPVAAPGRPLSVYLLGRPPVAPEDGQVRLFKYVSERAYDARRFETNAELLRSGELWAAVARAGSGDGDGWSWRRLSREVMRDPYAEGVFADLLKGAAGLRWRGGLVEVLPSDGSSLPAAALGGDWIEAEDSGDGGSGLLLRAGNTGRN